MVPCKVSGCSYVCYRTDYELQKFPNSLGNSACSVAKKVGKKYLKEMKRKKERRKRISKKKKNENYHATKRYKT